MTTPEETQTPAPASETLRYKPGHIANYMLRRAKAENKPLSLLKLLKLVYISYGWALAVLDRKLFDEPIQTWRHGPVIPSLYHEFKHYRRAPINEFSEEFNFESGRTEIPAIRTDDKNTHTVLNMVWDIYRDFDAWVLRDKTHEHDTPWSKAYRENGLFAPIPDSDIKDHFRDKITLTLDKVGA